MDIVNVGELQTSMDLKAFASMIYDYFEIVEGVFQRFNCFKVQILADTIVFGSGMGEYHAVDFVAELTFAALEIQNIICEKNQDEKNDFNIHLRLGMHMGSCNGKMLHLQVPRMLIFGQLPKILSLIHAYSLRKFLFYFLF